MIDDPNLDPNGGGAEPGADGGAAAAGDGGAAATRAWYEGLSGEAPDHKTPADLDWLKNKGFDKHETPAELVKSYRALESKLASDNRIEVPGEGATDEQRAAFFRAIGVPEKADDYSFDVPQGWEAEMAGLGAMREAALKGGMPVAAWNALAESYKQLQLDNHQALVTALDQSREAVLKEWGPQRDQNLALAKRGMAVLGLDADMVTAMQAAAQAQGKDGARILLEMGLKAGQLSGEDGFIDVPARDFGIPVEQAREELKRLEKDPEFFRLLQRKDSTALARQERLIAIIAADEERRARQQAA